MLAFFYAFMTADYDGLLTILGLIPFFSAIAFNATGLVRPKRIVVTADGFRYRPVWGKSRYTPWKAVCGFHSIFFESEGMGLITYRTTEKGRSAIRSLGAFLDVEDVARRLNDHRVGQ